MDALAYIDGEITPLADAHVPLDDRGHLLGDGIFETLRAKAGHIIARDLHEARLHHGMTVLGLDAMDMAKSALDAMLAAGAALGDDLYLRLNVSTGGMAGITAGTAPRITGIVRPHHATAPPHIRLVTSPIKVQSDSPLAGIKSLSFLPYIHARRDAAQRGADDALILNDRGRVAEASTSNVIAIIGDAIHAPGANEGAVDGITRRRIIQHAEEAGMTIITTLTLDQLHQADAVVLANTTNGITPIKSIDGASLGSDEGALARLQEAL